MGHAGRFYVTTPIYYVNDVPHVGSAYTTINADALRRFHQLVGDETYFLTGTDEHGEKAEEAAKKEGVEIKAYVDRMSTRFRDTWPKLDCKPDRFIRTTDPDHEAFVVDLWKTIQAKGDIYLGEYEGLYCVGCESFYTEKELDPGNVCKIHKTPTKLVKEPTYFFKLSKWGERLLDLWTRRPELVQPESRRNEVVSFVRSGLKDLACSRTTFTWGIPVPGDPKHIMYVWFDALTNYRSALGTGELARFWEPSGHVVHLVGKDILRFHAVYWPAFLLAAGYPEDALPTVFAHGFLTVDGQKMSKSLRNAVDPMRVAEQIGVDALRWQILKAVSFGLDGDFDRAGMLVRYNADLADNIGNLLSRVLGLVSKLAGGKVPALGEKTALEDELLARAKTELANVRAAWLAIEPNRALEATIALSSAANQYVDRAAPWATVKTDPARAHTQLRVLLEVLRVLATAIWPAMSAKSDAMRSTLGLAPLVPKIGEDIFPKSVELELADGAALAPPPPLFPKLDDKRQKEILAALAPAPDADQAKAPTSPASASEGSTTVTYDDFAKIDLRVGVVKTCEKVPKKDKLLRLTVDLGEPEPRTIVAGLALTFAPDALVGRRVVVVANLAPRSFGGGLVSHGMLLASGPCGTSNKLVLATIGDDAPPGARLK
ncbi:MAG TPA: methionine--tRNA ligase [Labilithrix sp.]